MFKPNRLAAVLILGAAAITALFSCAASKESVKLSDSSDMEKYAEKNFGKAQLLSADTSSDTEAVYTFKDEEYGFEYSVRSFASGNRVDGDVLGYSEKKSSDFSEKFQNYIDSQISDELEKYEQQYHFEFEWKGGNSDDIAGTLVFDEAYTSNAQEAAEKTAECILRIDDRGYFESVIAKSSNGYYAVYDLKNKKFESN